MHRRESKSDDSLNCLKKSELKNRESSEWFSFYRRLSSSKSESDFFKFIRVATGQKSPNTFLMDCSHENQISNMDVSYISQDCRKSSIFSYTKIHKCAEKGRIIDVSHSNSEECLRPLEMWGDGVDDGVKYDDRMTEMKFDSYGSSSCDTLSTRVSLSSSSPAHSIDFSYRRFSVAESIPRERASTSTISINEQESIWLGINFDDIECSDPPRGLLFPFPVRALSKSVSAPDILHGDIGHQI